MPRALGGWVTHQNQPGFTYQDQTSEVGSVAVGCDRLAF
jgi:hypothetical protein